MIIQALNTRQGFGPVRRVHVQVYALILTRLVSFTRGDVSWTVAAMTLRLLAVALACGERQFAQWAQRVLYRAWQGARFAAELDDADTMVAAGRR